ncbi:hypothetical protein N665_0042s0016 [Sinapis alba]|nr:hypothetical protein N665_0042s0016 [Sinapis alba]
MHVQWGMEERVTANDLGNWKFLFNFTSEEDLNSVLRQGPFHFNFCMFVLVRWEPIVHDDYPWIIPFWIRLIGVPLQLWTVTNVKKIGARLGVVDTLELAQGRMPVNVDSRKPLKLSRKVESPNGDEVTIEIKYDKLFKHCSLCGMLTHEKELCPSLDMKSQNQPSSARQGVFTRVQPPLDLPQRYTPQEDLRSNSSRTWLSRTESSSHHRNSRDDKGGWKSEMETNAYSGTHSSRIERRQNEYSRGALYGGLQDRYGGLQAGKGPYDRAPKQSWRKKNSKTAASGSRQVQVDKASGSCDVVSYEQQGKIIAGALESSDLPPEEGRSIRRLESMIVTPSHDGLSMEANVTRWHHEVARVLSFPTDRELASSVGSNQVIGALKDMDLDDQQVGEMMDCEVQEDDLLGLELKEMEDKTGLSDPKGEETSAKLVKLGNKANVPRGFPNKKFEFLCRGSPRKRSIHSHGALIAGETGKSRRQYESSKKQRVSKSKGDGLMSSKNSSSNHI